MLVDRRSKKAGMALERDGVKTRFASQYLPVILRILGFNLAPHAGGEKTESSLALLLCLAIYKVDIQSEEYA